MTDTDSVNTFNSWASDLTTCEPLDKALSRFDGSTKLQRKVLEIVTSMKNSIVKNGGTETSTEFYASMVAFLKATEVDIETMEACVYILKHLLRQHIPVAVLRYTTSDLSKILLNLLTGTFGKNELIVKTALFCLSKLIAAQPEDNWKLDNITHLYRTLFSFTTDSRKSINKDARKSVLLIFSSKTKTDGLLSKKHPLNKETIAILTNSIRTQNTTNKKRDNFDCKIKPSLEDDRLSFSLTTLSTLLQSKLFNSECVIVYLETLIQCLLSLQIVPIQCQILNIFSELFIRRVLFPEQIARSVTSLFTYLTTICNGKQQSIPPSFIGSTWLNAVSMGFESLLLSEQMTFVDSANGQTMDSRIVALTHATHIIKTCCDWLLCDCQDLSKSAFDTLSKLCEGNLTTQESEEHYLDPERYTDTGNWLCKWGDIVCRLLSLGGHNTGLWTRSINCLVYLTTRSMGKCEQFISLLLQVLPQVAELRDSYEDTEEEAIAALVSDNKFKRGRPRESLSAEERALQSATESLVGCAIKMYGPSVVARALPLSDAALLSSTRAWLVPLVKHYTERTELDHFRTLILPLIQQVSRQIDDISQPIEMEVDSVNVAAKGPSPAVVTLGTLRYQLWSCLPSFAKGVIAGGLRTVGERPIEESQQIAGLPTGVTLWQLLLSLLNSQQSTNLEVVVLTAIRNVIGTAQQPDEMREVMTSGALFPQLVQRMFSLYLQQTSGDRAISANITATLAVYLPLFEPATFDANCVFLMNNKLADVDRASPTEQQLRCVDLLLMLGPHLTVEKIGAVSNFLATYLVGDNSDNGNASNGLQKRAYRYLQLISAADTATSNEYTKANIPTILQQLHAWAGTVRADSRKCRTRCIYNVMKLLSTRADIAALMNGFLAEMIGCLNMPNKKTRAVAGMLLVEAVIACSNDEDDDDNTGGMTLTQSIDAMLQRIVTCLRDAIPDTTLQGIQYKGALAKALYLIVSENRLARSVSRQHMVDIMAIVSDILQRASSSNVGTTGSGGPDNTRHLVYCALDILSGLLKKKAANFDKIYLVDVGNCITTASHELRLKVRMPIKRILKKMLKLWEYENIKKCIPADLIPVLRNIHKSMARSTRNKDGKDKDNESCATSWAGVSDVASQNTMKNPHIKNIAELLHDTDSEDEDLKSRMTATTLGNKSTKSSKSTVSRANELRAQRKRKIDSANATLHLEEKLDDIVDLSDPTSMVRHMRISDRKERSVSIAAEQSKPVKVVDRRGFHFEGGRLVIGKTTEEKTDIVADKAGDEDDSENEHYKSEKGRFQPVKKRMRKEKLPGSEYKSHKKGVFGDMKKKDKPDPYAYIPFKSADQCHSVMKNYEKETRKAQKAARQMSKLKKKKQ